MDNNSNNPHVGKLVDHTEYKSILQQPPTGEVTAPIAGDPMTVNTGDFIFYVLDERGHLELAVGERTRDWMDSSANKHAYRCLPLVIANQMGWDFLCPVDFMVVWDGGPGVENIHIGWKKDDNHELVMHPGISSHFGIGTFTFSLGGIFRTPHGANLWAKGAGNFIKDGAQALEGIIETDWAPFTFTMNWKITRPNFPVEFKKGDPVCRVVPYPRGYIQKFTGIVEKAANHPQMLEEYNNWSANRDRFNKQLKVAETPEAKDGWQKHYMKGRTFPGTSEFKEHETKIQLKPFVKKEIDGYVFTVPEGTELSKPE